jgi:hypothetical protein
VGKLIHKEPDDDAGYEPRKEQPASLNFSPIPENKMMVVFHE